MSSVVVVVHRQSCRPESDHNHLNYVATTCVPYVAITLPLVPCVWLLLSKKNRVRCSMSAPALVALGGVVADAEKRLSLV